MNILFITLLVCHVRFAISDNDLEACQLEDGKTGVCRKVENCPYALNLLRQKTFPQICNFEGNDVFVCCLEIYARKSPKRMPGELSRTKCKDYYLLSPFVYNAKKALSKEFPHMAAIGYDTDDGIQWGCGGALISNTFILTAAHCLISSRAGAAKYVRLGDLDLATVTDDTISQDRLVKRAIPHPDYNPPSKYHDIGLIELDSSVSRTDYVNVACLYPKREYDNLYMIAAGWGKTEYAGQQSSFLLNANLSVVPQETCRKYYGRTDADTLPNGIVDGFMLCAGGESDTCQGDSGGPLFIPTVNISWTTRVYYLVGITSFGKACGVGKIPGVYTRIYNYLQWIESIVWPE